MNYRYLKEGEVIQEGDETEINGHWRITKLTEHTFSDPGECATHYLKIISAAIASAERET